MDAAAVEAQAGGRVADVAGRELVALAHDARRTPVSAGTAALFEEVLAARAALPSGRPARRLH